MQLGSMIGEGGNSEVFEWENNQRIIKLAKSNITKVSLQHEFNNTLTAWNLGLPVPKPFEIIEINNRPGLVFERIHGETLKERLFKRLLIQEDVNQPIFDSNDVRLTAHLLSQVHHLSSSKLIPQRPHLKQQICKVDYLNEAEKDSVIKLIDKLPIKNNFCHGDPNPGNIILRNDELVFIDWMDTTSGNPETDIAEYIVMIKFTILPPETPLLLVKLFDSIREDIIKTFMDEYTLLTGTTYAEIEPWIAPIAARKLSSDAISEAEKQLLLKEIRIRL